LLAIMEAKMDTNRETEYDADKEWKAWRVKKVF
jgi:hypothetical protein